MTNVFHSILSFSRICLGLGCGSRSQRGEWPKHKWQRSSIQWHELAEVSCPQTLWYKKTSVAYCYKGMNLLKTSKVFFFLIPDCIQAYISWKLVTSTWANLFTFGSLQWSFSEIQFQDFNVGLIFQPYSTQSLQKKHLPYVRTKEAGFTFPRSFFLL